MGRLNDIFTKERFLTAISFIYLFAFTSLYIQLPGLYGDNGITPVRLLHIPKPSTVEDFIKEPNLLRLREYLNLDVYTMLELCTLVGGILAFLAAFSEDFRTFGVFLMMWMAYFSAVKVGQVFLWFQWDIMLLEAGFIAILLAKLSASFPVRYSASDAISLWLLRWLLFRLMFSAGVVKLTSNCPAWWGLEALHWHYQSQCIPNPVAWHAHHLPGWMHNFSVASTLIIEILLPLLFFVPLRLVRLFSFYSQLLLQGLIILTGNFNFFNLLTMALCYSLLKDEDFNTRRRKTTGISSRLSNLLSLIIIGVVLVFGGYLFNFRVTPEYTITSSVGFTKAQFNQFLTHAVSYSICAAVALFAIQVYCSLVCALKTQKLWRKCAELAGVVAVGIIGLALLFSSFVPFANLDGQSVEKLPVSVRQIHSQLRPYHLTNAYGLFRRMTGFGGRPEVILEGAPSVEGPWTEYHFRFKPGRVNRTPPVVIPHQPRVDWQLWFAALSQPNDHPWFYNLVYRLLQQEPDETQSNGMQYPVAEDCPLRSIAVDGYIHDTN
ncbi:hypothetical protein CRM22_002569 [Opisthorchis felineus]|uniref:Lipase maturation factor n=1 Tax=Opisthorchis felineus TaxID=147828 RepID=A0A4S2M5Y5_OPIFE|nr:hypothetical protein CRM22_002569 [Opisthorchis felineus]